MQTIDNESDGSRRLIPETDIEKLVIAEMIRAKLPMDTGRYISSHRAYEPGQDLDRKWQTFVEAPRSSSVAEDGSLDLWLNVVPVNSADLLDGPLLKGRVWAEVTYYNEIRLSWTIPPHPWILDIRGAVGHDDNFPSLFEPKDWPPVIADSDDLISQMFDGKGDLK